MKHVGVAALAFGGGTADGEFAAGEGRVSLDTRKALRHGLRGVLE